MIALYMVAGAYAALLLYILAMGIYRAYLSGRMPKWMLIALYPVVILLLLVDLLGNITIGTLLFVDPPRERMFTQRLIRYRNSPARWGWWRYSTAAWICDHALDIFDPAGDHC